MVYKVIDIEIIDKCNSMCKICPRRLIYQTGEIIDIKKLIDNILECIDKEIIDKNPGISIGCFGEPLLDNDFLNKIKLLKENIDCYTSLYTNAILIDKFEEQLKKDKYLDELIISNYGNDIEHFYQITGVKLIPQKFKLMKNAIQE